MSKKHDEAEEFERRSPPKLSAVAAEDPAPAPAGEGSPVLEPSGDLPVYPTAEELDELFALQRQAKEEAQLARAARENLVVRKLIEENAALKAASKSASKGK